MAPGISAKSKQNTRALQQDHRAPCFCAVGCARRQWSASSRAYKAKGGSWCALDLEVRRCDSPPCRVVNTVGHHVSW
jgi:hypothetical protein